MIELMESFAKTVGDDQVEIYNEFSFQHELGIFLRGHIPHKKIQFERNVGHFGFEKILFEKKEIDISIFNQSNLDSVIELKYPRNGQVPETMYSFCKDIAFLEQLVSAGFKSGYFFVIVDDPLFYSGDPKGIYGLFRDKQPITGVIAKPTGNTDKTITIKGAYYLDWKDVGNGSKYGIIRIHGN